MKWFIGEMLLGFSCWIALQRIFLSRIPNFRQTRLVKTNFKIEPNCCVFRPANACAEKHWKMMKKYPFHHAHERLMWDPWRKMKKIPNEQPAFGCQPAFGSHSQLLTNKLFSSFFFTSLTWASHTYDEKGAFRPCESMRKHAFAGRSTQQLLMELSISCLVSCFNKYDLFSTFSTAQLKVDWQLYKR